MENYDQSVVTKVIEKSDVDNYPLLVSFQNGVLKSKKAHIFNVDVSTITKLPNKRKRLSLSSVDGPSYVGEEEKLPVRSFLLVRNRKTAEARLLEVGKVNLKNSLLEIQKDVEKKAEYDDFSNLMITFGGKRANRVLQQRSKLNLGLNTNTATLTEVVNEMEVKEEPTSDATAGKDSLLSILPPCNRNATDKTKVYNLTELIGEDVMNAIADYEGPSLLQDDELSDFTRSLVPAGGISDLSKPKIAALNMIDDMIKFFNMNMKIVNYSSTSLSKHSVIHNRILELFCSKSGGSILHRPPSLRDKTIAYILAIALVVGNYNISLDSLSKLLKSSVQNLKTIGRAIGGSAQADRLILKLPLPGIPLPRRVKQKSKE